MANLLGVTNPVPGHDSTTANRSLPVSPNDTHIQNIPGPNASGPRRRPHRQAGHCGHRQLKQTAVRFELSKLFAAAERKPGNGNHPFEITDEPAGNRGFFRHGGGDCD